MDKEYYSIKEVAQYLKVCPTTIYRHIYSGELQAEKVGKLWRISSEQIKAFTTRGI